MSVRRKRTLSWALKFAADNPDIAAALALPQVPDILNTIDDYRAARFFILSVPQVFKSLLGQLRLMRSRQVEPRSALWYRESDKQIESFAEEKLNLLFDACPTLPPLLMADRNKRTKLRATFADGNTFSLLSAGVDGNRQSKTACDIYFDEPWLYGVGWVGEIQKRRGSYPHDFREIYMMTGPFAKSEADQGWQASNKKTWFCRCPHCEKTFFPARTHHAEKSGELIGGLIYDTVLLPDGLPNEAAISRSVVYQCPLCRKTIPNSDAARRAMSGTAAAPVGEYVVMNEGAAPNTFGWHVHHIALKDWAELAVKMVKAEIARTRAGDLTITEEITRLYDAATWDPEKYHRAESFNRYQHPTPYVMGEPWPAELKDAQSRPFRFGLIDVQLDHFYLVIRAWGKWSQSRLVFAKRCLSPSEMDDALKQYGVPPERTFVDTRYDSQRVRRLAARMGWMTFMGDKETKDYRHEDGIRRIFDQPQAKDAMTGTVLQGRSESCVVETIFSKNAALNRLALLRDPDSLSPEQIPLWTAASDAPDWYFKQINAHYRKRVDMPDGSHHYVWHGQKDDHAGDCEAMAVVAASMANLTGAESLDAPKQTEPEPQFENKMLPSGIMVSSRLK